MNSLRTGLLAAIAIFAFPSAAVAEELVPPGNSAVNQYTETFPTPGGDRETGKGAKPAKPAKVLGGHNAKKLEAQGPDGREVAAVAATTAPSTVVTPEPEPVQEASDDEQAGGGTAGGGDDRGGQAREEGIGPARAVDRAPAESLPVARGTGEPSGSSGFGEVLAQATGTSSGELGLLLPLALLAAIAWAIATTRRRPRRPAQ